MSTEFSKNALRKDLPTYTALLKKRLKSGMDVYGDISFSRSPKELIDEIQLELLDISGWGFILWHRLEKLKAQVDTLTGSPS